MYSLGGIHTDNGGNLQVICLLTGSVGYLLIVEVFIGSVGYLLVK